MTNQPLNFLIPKFLSFFASPDASLRRYSVGCVNHFVLFMPHALRSHIDGYVQVAAPAPARALGFHRSPHP